MTDEGERINLDVDVDRFTLNELSDQVVKRSREKVIEALSDANLTKEDINYLVFVGGPTKMPFLRETIEVLLNSIKLMKLIIEAKKSVQPSPMAFRDFNFGKFNLSLSNKKDINDLILNKDEKFSDPYDLFKVSMNKLSDKDIIGIEEVTEFKKRFSTIKVTSDFAHLKRIKAIDFFKIYINNFSREKEDYLILNYICEKKRMLVKHIEL